MTLYDERGVDPTADAASIKKAVRKKARENHPDHGGDRDKFELIILARDTLLDDEKRAHYDATGSADDKTEEGEALEIISSAIDAILAALAKDGRGLGVENLDMIKNLWTHLNAALADCDEKIEPHVTSIDNHKRMIGRFSTAAGDKPSPIDEMIRVKIGQIEANLRPLRHRRKLILMGIAMVELSEYRSDPVNNFGPLGFNVQGGGGWKEWR